ESLADFFSCRFSPLWLSSRPPRRRQRRFTERRSSSMTTGVLTGSRAWPLTNLAEALALDPSIKDNIKLVEVSGGAIHVAGNIRDGVPRSPNTTAEWNIFVDSVAAE